MLAIQRRRKILELLQEEGSARVSALSRLFGVSEPTVRQDLERLEVEGFVVREHGGAFLKSVPQQVKNLNLQHLENMDKKARIGRRAAEMIHDEDSLILDSGSTVTELARNLGTKHHLRIITNALNIALLLGTEFSFEILVTGGEFKAPTLSLTGERTAAFFDRIHVQKTFLAVGGVSLEAGLSYPGFADIVVKKAMIEAASEVVLLADSTKIGKVAFAALGPVDLVHYLVTDNGISDEQRDAFESHGVKVIIA
ncbi:MAG: DeoR/GlpR family DNA-binding transcription regulator [Spirochaetia bacterium]